MAKKKLADYENDIKQLHASIEEYPEVDKLKKTLNHRLGKWFELLDVTIFVASNEQTEWTAEELGHKTRPMLTKHEAGMQQVGDYQIFVDGHGKSLPDSFSSLLVERKGSTYERDARGGLNMIGCDLYSTAMNKSNRERFYREIDRFPVDDRFDRMVVICECTYEQFLRFVPKFTGKKFNKNHVGASVASRVATINSLEERGISVRFMGSRKRAIEAYQSMIRLNVVSNYERWIDCEPDSIERPPCAYNYHDPLHEDLCIFEVTLTDLLVADSQLTPKAQEYRDELMIGVRRMADKVAGYERVYDY